MLHARPDELTLALTSVFAAGGASTLALRKCSDLMEHATTAARIAPQRALDAIGAGDPTAVRLGAVRVLASICADCGACPRGQA